MRPPSNAPKKRRTTRLFKSPVAKGLGITASAVIPLVLVRQQWNKLLEDPTSTLTGLLGSIFVLQVTYVILLLPVPVHGAKKPGAKAVDSLGEAIRSQIAVRSHKV